MRWFVGLVLGLLLPSCLYLGGINHDPEGAIVIQQSSARLEHKGSVTLEAAVSDPDGDDLSFSLRVGFTDLDSQTWIVTSSTGATRKPEGADDGTVIGAGPQLTLSPLPERGTYRADLLVTDEQGASIALQTTFTVKNSPPQNLKLLLTADPDYRELDQVPDINGAYPAHAHYLVRISEAAVQDLEGDLICGGRAAVTWTLKPSSALSLEYQKVRTCQGLEVLDRLRFRFAEPTPTQAQPLTITALVDDGRGGKGQGTLTVNLAPNRPPCILGTDPSFSEASSVGVLSTQGKRFEVTHLSDDVLGGTQVQWLVAETSGGPFSVVPGQSGPVFDLPKWLAFPGEKRFLRVLVRDAQSAFPGCTGASATCAPYKPLPSGCYQGITWSLLFL